MAFRQQSLGAFPGDTYIEDLKKGTKSKRSWLKFLLIIMIISGVADYFIMTNLFGHVTDAVDNPFEIASFDDLVSFLTAWVLPAVLVVGYLGLGVIAGRKRKEWRTFGKRSSKRLWRISFILELVSLVVILAVRWYFEYIDNSGVIASTSNISGSGLFASTELQESSIQSTTSFDLDAATTATYQTLLLGCIMAFGAFASLVHSYYAGDTVVSEILHSARAHLPEDVAIYEKTYFEFAGNSKKDKEYEIEERSADERILESTIRLNEIKAKLLGVLDPADSHDFIQAATNDYQVSMDKS